MSQALPIYYDMVQAVISYENDDRAACAGHVANITAQLRPLLGAYYDRLHDKVIARSAWLSHVQGFFAWGAGYEDELTGEWVKFDGLSGNQVLLFQALDAFLGLPPYLSREDKLRNVPARQRQFCDVMEKYSFRRHLEEPTTAKEVTGDDAALLEEFGKILKHLRVGHALPT